MTSDELKARARVIFNAILAQCSKSEFAEQISVFGSVARGAKTPGDLDIALDLRHLTYDEFVQTGTRDQVKFLLILGRRKTFNFVGHFDPFIILSDCLLCRDAESAYWIEAENAPALLNNIQQEGVPLATISPFCTPS